MDLEHMLMGAHTCDSMSRLMLADALEEASRDQEAALARNQDIFVWSDGSTLGIDLGKHRQCVLDALGDTARRFTWATALELAGRNQHAQVQVYIASLHPLDSYDMDYLRRVRTHFDPDSTDDLHLGLDIQLAVRFFDYTQAYEDPEGPYLLCEHIVNEQIMGLRTRAGLEVTPLALHEAWR
jgi:hypothetical protein